MIFKNPVLAADNHYYEKSAITIWLKDNDTSPMTNLKMKPDLVTSYEFNYILELFLKNNPAEIENQYTEKEASEIQHSEIIASLVKNKLYNKILDFKDIDLTLLIPDLFQDILEEADIKVQKHILDNAIDLECTEYEGGTRPIHLICKNSSLEIVKFIIEKGINLECEDFDKWRPIHFACMFNSFEVVKFLVEQKVDLECETDEQ